MRAHDSPRAGDGTRPPATTPWESPSRFGVPGRVARAALRRAARPVVQRQQELELALAGELERHAAELARLGTAHEAVRRELDDLRSLIVPAEREALLSSWSGLRLAQREGDATTALCSLATGDHVRLLAAASLTFEAYAARHGHDVVLATEPLSGDRAASWGKLQLIGELLDRYEWVLWVDADAAFVDVEPDILASTRPGKDLYLVEHRWAEDPDRRSANAGVMLWRSGDWARALLAALWDHERYAEHPWWENAALLDLLGYDVPHDLAPPVKVRETPWTPRVELLDAAWNSTQRDAYAVIRHHGRPDPFGVRYELLLADVVALRRRLAGSAVRQPPVERDLA